MTAATYDFTLSAAQSTASSMVVELQPDASSATPGTDDRWQGGRPRVTLNWAANVLVAQATVNTLGNNSVQGNGVYKWVKISSSPSNLALDLSQLPTVTILEDDSNGGGGSNIVYGPTTTTNTTVQPTGARLHKVSTKWRDNKLITLRVAINGNTYAELKQDGATAVNYRIYTNGVASAPQILNGISAAPANGDTVSFEVRFFPGSTDYEAYATYGPYSQGFGLGGLTGTDAQGEIWYTGDGTGEPFTITKN